MHSTLPSPWPRRALTATAALALLVPLAATAPTTPSAHAEPVPVPLPQSDMAVVDVDSVEPGDDAEHVLDGDPGTIWHTAWSSGKDPLPHHLSVRIADEPQDITQVRLLPRSSSNGSGRIGKYEVLTSTDPECADDAYTTAATGEFDGLLAHATDERTVELDAPTAATCVKVVWLSSWGGRASDPETSPAEEVASLAEFNVDVMGEPAPGDPITVDPPEGTVEITDGTVGVRLHPDFPQVVDYRVGERTLAGRYGAALTTVRIDDQARTVETSGPELAENGASATYHLTVPDLPGVSVDAVLSIQDGVFTWTLTNIEDPDSVVHRISVPRLDLASAQGLEDGAQLVASDMSVDRGRSGDHFYDLADQAAGTTVSDPAYLAMITNGTMAAGFETNAVEDNTAGGATAGRVQNDNSRFVATVGAGDGAAYGTVSPGTFVVRGSTTDLGLGADEDPYVRVRLTADANDDGEVTWQDAAIAARSVQDEVNGGEDTADNVITRIPFNIVSQATHPFLRTLDDTKRVSLATDGLGQRVMLKGYQAEGHDSAHPDYAGNYNERAGGKEDFDTLVTEGEQWNATFGVHVNATESYSEANAFSEDLLQQPIRPGWGWMNQSYLIDGPKDLGTTNVLDRFQALRDETPENLTFLYMDVYYPNGWEGQRLSYELERQGWDVSTEWADKFPRYSTWSHWANDESYGGSSNKGLNSQVLRFVSNADKDVWNPDPLLSNANVQEFEGWTGHHDVNAFFDMVWERNLPTKYLQQADIMRWTPAKDGAEGKVVLENGTEVTSSVESVSGTEIPTDREIRTDGKVVYEDGRYLLPWDDGEARLYHWNPEGGTSTWTLTDAWADQTSLTAYALTDTGRTDPTTVKVTDGKVTLSAKKGTAYVLLPSSELTEVPDPQWGEGTTLTDPSFFSGSLDAWTTDGKTAVVVDDNGNAQAQLGRGKAAISQSLHDPAHPSKPLPKGTYSAWAWIEVQPGTEREVTVSATGKGVTAQDGTKGSATATISSSTALNSTASDDNAGTYFQRVRVVFTTDGKPVTLAVTGAAPGSAPVLVDDLRVVPFTPAKDPAPTEQTVLFEDFEHVDTGYWPFVTGETNAGGDARTQLAKRHEPYSQSGWYGVDQDGKAVEGGKLTDNVLRGDWSLMANEENEGRILRTTQASLPLVPGHRYRISVDHQTAFADTYAVVIGEDTVAAEPTATEVERLPLPEARETAHFTHEFTASADADVTWVGIQKTGGGRQANLTLDDLRVEELGPAS